MAFLFGKSDENRKASSSIWYPPKTPPKGNEQSAKQEYKSCRIKKGPYRLKTASTKISTAQSYIFGWKLSNLQNQQSNLLFTTIKTADSHELLKKVQQILDQKQGYVNAVDSDGQSPLMYVIKYQKDKLCIKLVDLLIKNGADIKAIDSNGKNIIHLALEFKNYPIAIRLLKNHPNLSSHESLLKMCAKIGDSTLDVVKTIISTQKVDINGIDEETALHVAAKRGSLKIVEELIKNRYNLDCRDSEGRTPLHLAALNFNYDIVQFLLDSGADSSIQDCNQKTASELAAQKLYGQGLQTMNCFTSHSKNQNEKRSEMNTPSLKTNDKRSADTEEIVTTPLKRFKNDDEPEEEIISIMTNNVRKEAGLPPLNCFQQEHVENLQQSSINSWNPIKNGKLNMASANRVAILCPEPQVIQPNFDTTFRSNFRSKVVKNSSSGPKIKSSNFFYPSSC